MDIAALLGGIGLFLLGMSMMTEGLKVAAGPALKSILGSWTRSAPRGLAAGVLITAIVQSSSATIVAVIGFVNAGLLTLTQAIWVVFGSSVGTTTTGWLVAQIGVKVDMGALALPLLGAGMMAHVFARGRPRLSGFGQATAGFGAFFLGIAILQSAFAGLAPLLAEFQTVDTGRLTLAGFVALGAVLTLLTQSSSASIAIILTASAGGAAPLPLAAAMVIGANIGTTSTSILASLGGTPAARRAAVAHVAFNLISGVSAFLFLPVLLWVSGWLAGLLGLTAGPATQLAAFHTLFNLLGLVLIWPLAPFLVRGLLRLFVSEEEEIARPRHLDASLAGLSDLAASALYLETRRAAGLCFTFARDRLDGGPLRAAAARRVGIRALLSEIRRFVDRMTAETLPGPAAKAVPELVRALQNGETLLELSPGAPGEAGPIDAKIALADAVRDCLTLPEEGDDAEALDAASRAVTTAYEDLKDALLAELARGGRAVEPIERALGWAQTLERMGHAARHARRRLMKARSLAAPDKAETEPSTEAGRSPATP